MDVKIEITRDEATVALAALVALGEDLTPVMRGLAGVMHDSVEENFRAEGRPRWTPLAPSTLRKRRKSGRGTKILQDTGRLAGSIAFDWGRDFAVVGTNVVYGPIQHFGGSIARAAYSPLGLRLRTDRSGALVRNARGGAIFASASHKQARSVRAEVGAHSIRIPARPFLVVPDADMPKLLAIPAEALKAAWGK
jgi:phage virion morphogenesis protein